MPIIEKIKQFLLDKIHIDSLEIIDQTHQHKGHPQSDGFHLKMTVVSRDFKDKTLIERHRLVYNILDSMIKKEIHALSIVARTPDELDNA